MELEIRPYRPGDEGAINCAFQRSFGVARTLEEWHWKFTPPPGRPRRIYVAASPAGDVVAHYAAVELSLQVDGRIFAAGQIVDAFCLRRSGLARRGLFTRTAERFLADLGGPERIALFFGFPGKRHLRLGLMGLEYGEPVPVPYWYRPAPRQRPPGTLRRYLGRLGGRPSLRAGFDPAAVEEIWRQARERYPVAVVRDAAWVGRRYRGRPGVEYLHRAVWAAGRPVAYAVFRRQEGRLRWVELIWDGVDERAVSTLDDELLRLAGRGETGTIGGASPVPLDQELWLANDPRADKVLSDRGWERRDHPQRLQFSVRSFHGDLGVCDITRRMYLTWGDSDLV